MPAAAQHTHPQDAGDLCDDDDGGPLQLEAAGLLPEGRNQGLLTPEMGRIARARGHSRQNRDEVAGDGGDLPQRLSRIRPRSSQCGGVC